MLPAIAFVVILGLLVIFQLALAFGAPWGRFAWGGQHPGVLPTGFRIASAVSVLIYGFIGLLALDRVRLVDVLPDGVSHVGVWVVFAYLTLGVVMNAISRSKPERYTMTPVVLVLAVLALLIALAGPQSVADRTDRGIPESHSGIGAGGVLDSEPSVAWIDEGTRFTLVTWGSSSCPSVVTSIEAVGADAVELVVEPSNAAGPCSADMAPTMHELTLPDAVSSRPVTVTLTYPDWPDRTVLTLT